MKKAKYRYTWSEILAEPTLNRLAERINRRWLYMSEADVMWIINEVLNSKRILDSKELLEEEL